MAQRNRYACDISFIGNFYNGGNNRIRSAYMNGKFDISAFVDALTVPAAANKVVDRMKVRRHAMKISQQELSKRSGVSYASIRRFETTGEIAFLSLLKIALALDCLEDFTSLFHKPEPQNLKDL